MSNKHAAIQGLPNIPKDEAECIMKAILELKGARTKKQKDAHEEGNLKLARKPLTYKGAAKNWYREMAKHEDWTNIEPDCDINEVNQKPMKSIICPQCMESTSTCEMKLLVRSSFSNLIL